MCTNPLNTDAGHAALHLSSPHLLTSPEIFLKEQIQMDSETNFSQVHGQKRSSCVLSVPESGPHVEELTLPMGSICDHQSIVAPSQTLSVVDLFFPITSEPPLGSLSPPVRLTHGEHPLAVPCQVSRFRVPASTPYLFLRLQGASVSLPGVARMVPASTTQCKRQHGAAKRYPWNSEGSSEEEAGTWSCIALKGVGRA